MKRYQVLLLLFSSGACVTADIAPTTFDSSDIAVIEAKGVSMESAEVDITWGDPCRAKAVFTLLNHTDKPQTIHIGFPIQVLPLELQEVKKYTIAFNGSDAERLGRSTYKKKKEDVAPYLLYGESFKGEDGGEVELEWFGKSMEFPVGQSEVTVTYDIPLGGSYRLPYRRVINYILSTGSGWAGNIKKETVTIHFPRGLDSRQVEGRTHPSNYSLNSNSISWCFTDFEPTRDDDITLEFLDPFAFSDLKRIEEYDARYSSSSVVRLALVKHYFALGPRKGCGHWLPDSFSKAEIDSVIAATQKQEDREFFMARLKINPDGRYQLSVAKGEWGKIYEILSEAYVPSDAHSPYVDKAKKILEDHLETHPDDAYAWLIYLHNYYRFNFCGYPYGAEPKQKAVIEKALQHCPDDDILQLWKELFETRDERSADSFFQDGEGGNHYFWEDGTGEDLIGITSGLFPLLIEHELSR